MCVCVCIDMCVCAYACVCAHMQNIHVQVPASVLNSSDRFVHYVIDYVHIYICFYDVRICACACACRLPSRYPGAKLCRTFARIIERETKNAPAASFERSKRVTVRFVGMISVFHLVSHLFLFQDQGSMIPLGQPTLHHGKQKQQIHI